VEAYNALATMAMERGEVSGWTGSVPLKQPGDSVTQNDLNVVRAKVVSLMKNPMVLAPEDVAEYPFKAGVRWSGGVLVEPSLMSGIGHNGYFTSVPPECTVSGNGVYSHSFGDVPLLWIHFYELYQVLLRARYTKQAYYTDWVDGGEDTRRTASCFSNTWEAATAEADVLYNAAEPRYSGLPRAHAIGRQSRNLDGYTARRTTYSAYGRVYNLSSTRPHVVHFYVYPVSGYIGGSIEIVRLDPNGIDVDMQWNHWCRWNQTGPTTATDVQSISKLGDGAWPNWGPVTELNPHVWRGSGWHAFDKPGAVIEWTDISDVAPENPQVDDPEDDGLVADGCECNDCLPQARADWRSMLASPQVKWPLGVSSGTGNGGLRVKAYVSEYSVAGDAQQMFSLDTHATRKSGGGGQWEFATVKRPGGAEVVFALKGERAGEPVNIMRSYRMSADAGGCEIRFENGVVHRFDSNGDLCQVRKRINHVEVSLDGSPSSWPGLTVGRSGLQITGVTSLLIAEPSYESGLIKDVTYRKFNGDELRRIELRDGSRRFVRYDPQGNVLDELRTVTGDGTAEIWHGVVTDGADVSVALKEVREESFNSSTNELSVRHSRVLSPDTPEARSNVTVTVFHTVAQNWEPVRRVEGWGGDDPQVTTWQYYTNAATDGGGYGRVRLLERPDGSWQRYTYDDGGRVVTAVTPFKDAAPGSADAQCRVLRYAYAGDAELASLGFPAGDVSYPNAPRPRLRVEEAQGIEVARTYNAYLADRHVVKRCVTSGAAYDAAGNLTTITSCHTNGTFAGRPMSVQRADGTVGLYEYAYDAGTARLTVTGRSGAGDTSDITNGTETVTLYDAAERPLQVRIRDIRSGLLVSGTDYTRDAVGRATCTSNVLDGTSETRMYHCYGPSRVTDAEGITTTNTYNRLRQVSCSGRLGVLTLHEYGVGGEVERTTQTAGGEPTVETRNAYDEVGRLLAASNALGHAVQYAYATNAAGGRVETVTRPDGSTHVTTYYRDGRLRSVSGSGAVPRCWDYGADEDGEYETEYSGADTSATQWERRYTDMLGRQWKTVFADGYTTTAEYDASGRVVRRSDGITTQLGEYDLVGERSIQAIDMNGNGQIDTAGTDRISETRSTYRTLTGREVMEQTSLRYAAQGSGNAETASVSATATDGSEVWVSAFGRTNRTLVARDRATATRTETVTRADGTRQVNTYSNGLLMAAVEQDSGGATVRDVGFEHDGYGRLSTATDAAADGTLRSTTYGYDAIGQVTNVTVTAGAETRRTAYEYDEMGRLVRQTLPDGGVVERQYSARGELVVESGARTYPVSFTYDAQGRVATLSTFRAGLAGTADATQWEYDSQCGWPAKKTYADGSYVSYSYRADGALASRTWARGVETRYTYDAGGVLTNVWHSDGTPSVTYGVDRLGRPSTVSDGIGVWTTTYSPDGSPSSETRPDGWSVAWSTDALGRLTNTSLSHPVSSFQFPVSYSYDTAGRLATVANPEAGVAYTYGPDSVTWTSAVHSASGSDVLRTTRSFDSLDRLSQLSHSSPVSSFEFPVSHTHNSADQRTRCDLADGSYWTYSYDGMGQVIDGQKRDSGGNPVGGAGFEYEYDTVGNRTRATAEADSGTMGSYTANQLNQYEQVETGEDDGILNGTLFLIDGGPVTGSGTRLQQMDLSYDADGNLVSDGTSTYTWDAGNRLVSVSNVTTVVTYHYDHMGRRARRTATTVSGTTTNAFVYSGRLIVAELPHSHTHTLTNLYTWGLDLSGTMTGAGGIGGLLSVTRHPTRDTLLFSCDANGNVTHLLDTNGTAVATYEYGPFGEPIAATGPAAASNPFRFSTKYTDPDTALILYEFRPYNPTHARWLTRDPLQETGGLNLYGFVGNDGVNWVDPWGLEWRMGAGLRTTGRAFARGSRSSVQAIGRAGRGSARFLGKAGRGSAQLLGRAASGSINYGGKAVTAGRIGLGYVPSVLSGDIFDKSAIETSFERGQCEFLVTINGIANNYDMSMAVRNSASEAFGISGVRVVNNTHLLRMGDLLQILGHEIGLIDVTSRRAARQIAAAYQWGVDQGCECIRIVVVAHSQGTMVFRRALPLLSSDIRSSIEYYGDGGQDFIGSWHGLRSVDNAWNRSEGKGMLFFGWDIVPIAGTYANPFKLFGIPYHLAGGRVEHIRTGLDSSTGAAEEGNDHSWVPFYSWRYRE